MDVDGNNDDNEEVEDYVVAIPRTKKRGRRLIVFPGNQVVKHVLLASTFALLVNPHPFVWKNFKSGRISCFEEYMI